MNNLPLVLLMSRILYSTRLFQRMQYAYALFLKAYPAHSIYRLLSILCLFSLNQVICLLRIYEYFSLAVQCLIKSYPAFDVPAHFFIAKTFHRFAFSYPISISFSVSSTAPSPSFFPLSCLFSRIEVLCIIRPY